MKIAKRKIAAKNENSANLEIDIYIFASKFVKLEVCVNMIFFFGLATKTDKTEVFQILLATLTRQDIRKNSA